MAVRSIRNYRIRRNRAGFQALGTAALFAGLLLPRAAPGAAETGSGPLPEAAASVPAEPQPAPEALPFLAAENASDRFSVSKLTKVYDEYLIAFASQSSGRGPRTLEWLDEQARIAAAADDESTDARVTTSGSGSAATIPPEEKKRLEPPKPPVSVGIPSPVAIFGSLAGGLILLAKVISGLSR